MNGDCVRQTYRELFAADKNAGGNFEIADNLLDWTYYSTGVEFHLEHVRALVEVFDADDCS